MKSRTFLYATIYATVLMTQIILPLRAEDGIPTFDPGNPRASFAKMAEYLARDGGRWKAPNPNHDPSRPRSPDAFGLWFDCILGCRILELRIVVYRSDSAVVSSKGHWSWHPGQRNLRYLMVGRNGSRTEGATEFSNSRTFVTIATLFGRRGNESVHRDENVLVSEALHRNETFRRNGTGEWISQGVYEWRRTAKDAAAGQPR